MTSVRQRRVNKKLAAQAKAANQATKAGQKAGSASQPPKERQTARPTPERLAQGVWAKPRGGGKGMQPMVDLASDMIGVLHHAGKLSDAQEQAARDFQGMYAAFQADLGVTGYRSCLAGNVAGHDSGDGDDASVKAYNAMRDRIGRVKVQVLAHETAKLSHERPNNLPALQTALDVFIGY